jgi:excisionase family DNA binding protein
MARTKFTRESTTDHTDDALAEALPPFASVEQVAAAGGVHEATVRRAIAAGKLEATRWGEQWRVPRGAVRDWIESLNGAGGAGATPLRPGG